MSNIKTAAATSSSAARRCVSDDCTAIRSSLLAMLKSQVDPCRSSNTYVCDASEVTDVLQPVELPRTGVLIEDVQPGRKKTAQNANTKKDESTFTALRDLCVVYGDVVDAELADVMVFLSIFKLNLAAMHDSTDEDPLYRSMQLSLEFGIEPLLSFQRVFEYVVDASEPFRLEMGVSSHVQEFFSDWSQVSLDAWQKFYDYGLSLAGLSSAGALVRQLRDQLISADKDGVLQRRTDPVNQEPYIESPTAIAFEEMAQYTAGTVTARRWRQLLSEHSRSELVLHEGVLAYPRALALADLLSQPRRRLAMRRLLGWHLLLLLLAPKGDLIAAYHEALVDVKPAGYVQVRPAVSSFHT
ncbi:hypothetical protein HPB49_014135 [Dermacentor silvarum]|uniref:Uncharacterized protein n=1 Tax=Dermacentor silvarum TaxID=543639 RepID=A0ACB8CRC6_DERSI|nr:hypothetical protein HPB49_014135 [Dermacentor silvarum]